MPVEICLLPVSGKSLFQEVSASMTAKTSFTCMDSPIENLEMLVPIITSNIECFLERETTDLSIVISWEAHQQDSPIIHLQA